MMGQQGSGRERLFDAFNLDARVAADRPLRGIDRFLDLSDLHRQLTPSYSHTQRP